MEFKCRFIDIVKYFILTCFSVVTLNMIHCGAGYCAPGYDLCPEKIENMRALLAWQERHNEEVLRMVYTANYADEVRLNAEKHEIDSLIAADREFVYQCLQQAALQGQRISLTGGSPPRTANAIVKDAAQVADRKEANYSLGHATRQESAKAGEKWLGNNWHWSKDGKVQISADGLRRYRAAKPKDHRGGIVQANFEVRIPPNLAGKYGKSKFFNGHLYILNP